MIMINTQSCYNRKQTDSIQSNIDVLRVVKRRENKRVGEAYNSSNFYIYEPYVCVACFL